MHDFIGIEMFNNPTKYTPENSAVRRSIVRLLADSEVGFTKYELGFYQGVQYVVGYIRINDKQWYAHKTPIPTGFHQENDDMVFRSLKTRFVYGYKDYKEKYPVNREVTHA